MLQGFGFLIHERFALVFPGQGSQWVGMGYDLYQTLPSIRRLFNDADEILHFPLSRLCFEGPEELLSQTINAQPAIFTISIALLLACKEFGIEFDILRPSFVAGHSLGEYTALVAAGVLDFHQGLKLVRRRARLMQEVGRRERGGMLAILGLELEQVEEISRECQVEISNINCPGQIVVSGREENIERAALFAQSKGARVVRLKVSGAFHSSLMRRIVRKLIQVLCFFRFRRPKVPIIANSTAQPLTTTREIRRELKRQLCRCVQWQASVELMIRQGVTSFIELGPKDVLCRLIKRINPQVKAIPINSIASLKAISA